MRCRSSSKTNPILYMGTFFEGLKKTHNDTNKHCTTLAALQKTDKGEKNIASTNQMLIYLKANQAITSGKMENKSLLIFEW